MRKKPEADDTRFLPLREGGTGHGFAYRERTNHPRRFSILGRTDTKARTDLGRYSIDSDSMPTQREHTPEAVKARARAALLLAVERAHDELASDNTLTLNEISQSINSLGRVSGIAEDGERGPVTVTLVRVDSQAPHAVISQGVAPATLCDGETSDSNATAGDGASAET